MRALSPEKRRQVMQSRIDFWQVLREAMAADLAATHVGERSHSGATSPARTA